MKHPFSTTVLLVTLFVCSQLIGLAVLQSYQVTTLEGAVEYKELPYAIERPEIEEETSWLYITFAIVFGTVLLLILMKLGAVLITKLWFFAAVFLTLVLSLSAFIPQGIAALIAAIIALVKIFRPNPYIHNIAEVFMYGGIAALFQHVLTIKMVTILLIIISIYDMIAVWKLKHMVSMANYQTKHKLFAGAMIPLKKHHDAKKKSASIQTGTMPVAILGGGDMAFPLLFSGAVLMTYGIGYALITTFTTTIALAALFAYAQKGKFYPAMPFLSAGSFIGLIIVYVIG